MLIKLILNFQVQGKILPSILSILEIFFVSQYFNYMVNVTVVGLIVPKGT